MSRTRVSLLLLTILAGSSQIAFSQIDGLSATMRLFGHQEFAVDELSTDPVSAFSMGEHTLFMLARLNNRITFLGEHATRFDAKSSSQYVSSIERAQVRFDLTSKHSFMVGKMHTPVNYWNDVYHHGRLFFPTIDRPLMFSHLIPLHTLGVRFQGQNLGKNDFGYDVMVGNGIASTDGNDSQLLKSVTTAFHFKPMDGMRLGASYFFDHLDKNQPGAHSGHGAAVASAGPDRYTGPLDFHLVSGSLAYFTENNEFLAEVTGNITRTDSLGIAPNSAAFAYFGRRIGPNSMPYVYIDYLNIDPKDLHIMPGEHMRLAIGYRHEFGLFSNVKVEFREWMGENSHGSHGHGSRYEFRVQLSYGF
jgi:hypothetical protein